ncbi:hypothetical protein HGRIS_014037 [Hohenbuehelia grisea]|uniref:Uncharacterized protein n=1 Tax=Hohenbuehelia grisea TaxID=104357 RepID=A0ABR3JUB1_9AGAR
MILTSTLPSASQRDDAVLIDEQTPKAIQFQVIKGQNGDLPRQLAAKFGSTYVDIVQNYGAVEYIVDEEGEIIGFSPPEEYLAASDNLAINRYTSGDHDSHLPGITAGGLARLAYAEAYFYAVQLTQLRNEPAFLREQVESAAHYRPELLRDANGATPSIEHLLSKPHFIGQLARFTIHNMLSHLGVWDTIAKYLEDISNLDKTQGRLRAPGQRQAMLGDVKFMLEQEISLVEQRIQHGIIVYTSARRFWIRHSDLDDYAGVRIAINTAMHDELMTTIASQSLEGALLRFAGYEQINTILNTTKTELRTDMLSFLGQATEAQQDDLGGYLSHQLTQLKRLLDFLAMINHPVDVLAPPRLDSRCHVLGLALHETHRIISREVDLERYLPDIESLGNSSNLDAIWHSIDAAFLDSCGQLPESFIGFIPLAPQWNVEVSSFSDVPVDSSAVRDAPPLSRLATKASIDRIYLPPPIEPAMEDDEIQASKTTGLDLDLQSRTEKGDTAMDSTDDLSRAHTSLDSPPNADLVSLESVPKIVSSLANIDISTEIGDTNGVLDASKPIASPSVPEAFVKPKPYWTRLTTAPFTSSTNTTKKAKVKTRPANAPLPRRRDPEPEPAVLPPKLPVFYVNKKTYTVFDHIFSGGEKQGQITWGDFIRAMKQLGFEMSIKVSDGSRSMVTFIPPNENIPFVCHKPHSSTAAVQRMWQREYASGLAGLYGWSMEWFALKSEAPV